jgi:hypothetical protein
MTRRRPPSPRRWHWPDQEDINGCALMAVLIYAIFHAVTSCVMGPVTVGEPDIYEPAGFRCVHPTPEVASTEYWDVVNSGLKCRSST